LSESRVQKTSACPTFDSAATTTCWLLWGDEFRPTDDNGDTVSMNSKNFRDDLDRLQIQYEIMTSALELSKRLRSKSYLPRCVLVPGLNQLMAKSAQSAEAFFSYVLLGGQLYISGGASSLELVSKAFSLTLSAASSGHSQVQVIPPPAPEMGPSSGLPTELPVLNQITCVKPSNMTAFKKGKEIVANGIYSSGHVLWRDGRGQRMPAWSYDVMAEMSHYIAGPGMSHSMEHMSLDPGRPHGQAAASAYRPALPLFMAPFAQPGTSCGISYASLKTMYQDRSKEEPAYQQHQTIPKHELDRIYQDAVDIQYHERQLLHERVVHTEEKQETQVVMGQRQIITIEKVVEVPQVVVKETIRRVAKPEIVERIIEVPRTKIKKRTIIGPPQVQYQEQIIEVPQVIIEERVIHVPGPRTVQERLIEVPKVEWVERIEYDDYIEYREVPVDKIIEVLEIEYRIRESYSSRSMNSSQAAPAPAVTQAYGGSQASGATQAFGGSLYGLSEAMAQPVQRMAMSHANYDPGQVGQNASRSQSGVAAVGSQCMVPRGSMGPPGTQPF
ncbi:unnamed protein product, partial [Polarella glacialis]